MSPGARERVDQLGGCLGAKGVVDLGAVDRDAADAFGLAEGDVFVLVGGLPGDRHFRAVS